MSNTAVAKRLIDSRCLVYGVVVGVRQAPSTHGMGIMWVGRISGPPLQELLSKPLALAHFDNLESLDSDLPEAHLVTNALHNPPPLSAW